MPMPFSAIRRLLPSIIEATLICLASSLPDLLSLRPAAFFSFTPTRLPAILSVAYSRALKAAPVTSPLAPGRLLLDIGPLFRMYLSTMCTQGQYSSLSQIQKYHRPFPSSPSSCFTPIAEAVHRAVPSRVGGVLGAWMILTVGYHVSLLPHRRYLTLILQVLRYTVPCLTLRRIPALADALKSYRYDYGRAGDTGEGTNMNK
ncbi:hypothetical protein B0H19DRAFT_333087 [Mycena capillaripes]|nr:hypothetical protein B0H19DRAFT_333087 [Mycena capillaripes]